MAYREWVSLVKDVFQVLFFVLVGMITVLTYLKAKKTLLQPIRTEVFKEQLKLFSALLTMFAGKSEFELREQFSFDKLFRANTTLLLDDYASHFFDVRTNKEKRPYNEQSCPVTRIPEHLLVEADLHVRPAKKTERLPKPSPETKAAIWARYKFEIIKIPREFDEKERELRRFIASPLTPKKLSELLQEYLDRVEKNAHTLAKVLSSCAPELPEKYPSVEVLRNASTIWINNRYTDKFEDLEEKAREITAFLRSYFTVESIMK